MQLGPVGRQGPLATGNLWAKRHLNGRDGSRKNVEWPKPGNGERLAGLGLSDYPVAGLGGEERHKAS